MLRLTPDTLGDLALADPPASNFPIHIKLAIAVPQPIILIPQASACAGLSARYYLSSLCLAISYSYYVFGGQRSSGPGRHLR